MGKHAVPRRKPTPRMVEIIELIAQGYTDREIADKLFLGHETVRTHIARTREYLGARSKAHIVALAVEHGYITLGPQREETNNVQEGLRGHFHVGGGVGSNRRMQQPGGWRPEPWRYVQRRA